MLKEYKFDKVEAMNHLESVHGKKLVSFHTGTAYYTGQPRLYWQFEGVKEEWANPSPELGGWAVGRLFFPKYEVVSLKVDVYADTFEFVVREPPQKETATQSDASDPGVLPITLRQLMDVTADGVLFRIKDPNDDEKVVFSTDYMLKDEGVISVIADLLDVGVSKINVGVSEDPISPRDKLPTVWVELITNCEEAEGGRNP